MPSSGVVASSAILQLARELRTAMDQRFEPLGITSQQAGLLIHVVTGVTSPRRLSQLLGTDSAGTTRLLDRLEGKGLIERGRDAKDRRAISVALTKAGRALVPKLPTVFEDVAADLLESLDPTRVAADVETMLRNLRG
ncbi:MAG TPA: MarR family transcriptional regulator [Actinomycetales bacterium]|jgi:DNA-binding MarR family transcriptional regulator|nr:MarR family transcriptional regulator [Actinomycetales bacterium]